MQNFDAEKCFLHSKYFNALKLYFNSHFHNGKMFPKQTKNVDKAFCIENKRFAKARKVSRQKPDGLIFAILSSMLLGRNICFIVNAGTVIALSSQSRLETVLTIVCVSVDSAHIH